MISLCNMLYEDFLLLLLLLLLRYDIFIIKYTSSQILSFFIAEIIAESISLIFKIEKKIISAWWITIRFLYKKAYQDIQQDVLYITKNEEFQFISQKLWSRGCQMPYLTLTNVKEERWRFRLYFLKEIVIMKK